MVLDYKLYYWDLPFRGVFIEMFLADVGANYSRHDASDLYPERSLKIQIPGMAPPYLYDCALQKYFSQMPAILMHLAAKYERLPKRAEMRTLALKTILDCNDVLLEITNHHGLKMWDKPSWEMFRYSRLADWMRLFEQTGQEYGFNTSGKYLLGSTISVADIATAALFGTMVYAFPPLKEDLQEKAPNISALCERIEARPAIASYLEKQRAQHGRGYCGGQIETSLQKLIR